MSSRLYHNMNIDLIVEIADYLDCDNYYTLNKEIYDNITNKEKSLYWKNKYDIFFSNINKEYLILKESINWKKEYIRVKNTFWDNISNDTMLSIISKNNGIPKEIYNLKDLYLLDISNIQLDCVPIKLSKLENLKVLIININNIKNLETLQNFNNLEHIFIGNSNVDLKKKVKNLPNIEIHSYGNTRFFDKATCINLLTLIGGVIYWAYKYLY